MRVREMMTSAAAWLAEGLRARRERSSSDESIRCALLAELRSQVWWDQDRCDVMVRNGIVQITGGAASAQEKIATRTIAVGIRGVRGFKDGRPYCVPKGGYSQGASVGMRRSAASR